MMLNISVYSQHVTGKVTTASDGTPLPGVTVFLKGTAYGGVTDSDGLYSVPVFDSINSSLIFSFVGFVTQEIPVAGRSTIDVVLSEGSKQLDEVVITALGIPREMKTLVYSTQKVKTEELIEVRDANNFLNSLSGKIANSVITQASGGVGSGARIVLRGNRSIQNANNALIVVDGVPINNKTNYLYPDIAAENNFAGTDGASSLNPDDIESMTVLSGASASGPLWKCCGKWGYCNYDKKREVGTISR